MTIREARFVDVPRIVELMGEGYARSKYASRDSVDVSEAKQLVTGAIQRMTVKGEGGCCVFVAENDGTVEGYIIGVLERVYQVGTKLSATDIQFYASERADVRAFSHLFNAFEDWATGNPKVIEIRPGITDIIGDPERLAGFYERRGYHRSGLIYERSLK